MRSMDQAKSCVLSWCWQWWGSLIASEHSAIREADKQTGEPSKTTEARLRWGPRRRKNGSADVSTCWPSWGQLVFQKKETVGWLYWMRMFGLAAFLKKLFLWTHI
jgi:hypothetical protein